MSRVLWGERTRPRLLSADRPELAGSAPLACSLPAHLWRRHRWAGSEWLGRPMAWAYQGFAIVILELSVERTQGPANQAARAMAAAISTGFWKGLCNSIVD